MHLLTLADPVGGQEPSDQVRSFTFTSNLAAQEISGDMDVSVSIERILQDLSGSPESRSQLIVATQDEPVPLSATVAEHQEDPWIDSAGWAKVTLPLIDDAATVSVDIVLDAAHLPVPGTPLEGEASEVIAVLLGAAHDVAARHGRTVLHTAHMHPAGDNGSLCVREGHCSALVAAGYAYAHQEVQQVIELSDLSHSPLPAGLTLHTVEGMHFAPELINGIVALQDIAAKDIPHGNLTTSPAQWSPSRLARQAELSTHRGYTPLSAIMTDPEGDVVCFSTVGLPPGANPHAAEQGLTIVEPHFRGKGLARLVKLACLSFLRTAHPEVRRIATSNAVDNHAMLAVNRALGAREISRTTLWEKNLN